MEKRNGNVNILNVSLKPEDKETTIFIDRKEFTDGTFLR